MPEFSALRSRLNDRGFTPQHVIVPGDEATEPPLEGALRLREHGNGFVIESVDYGSGLPVATAPDAEGAAEALLAYLSRPLPEPTALPEATVHAWVTDVAKHYFELRDRVAASGPMIIDLPPHLPLDRIGGIDGWRLTPLDTPFELRSLPPTAILPPAEVHRFVTRAAIRVGVRIVEPWFGRPGGALVFLMQEPGFAIRDALASGHLERITIER